MCPNLKKKKVLSGWAEKIQNKLLVSELRLEPGTSWIWSMKPTHLTFRFSIKYLNKYLF